MPGGVCVVGIDAAGVDEPRAVDAYLRPIPETNRVLDIPAQRLLRRIEDVRTVSAKVDVVVWRSRDETAEPPHDRSLRIEHFRVVDGSTGERQRSEPP